MKICLLTPRFPYPENGGDVVLINDITHYLKDGGNEIYLISYFEKTQQSEINKKYPFIDHLVPVKRIKIVSLFNSLIFRLLGLPIQCGYYYSRSMLKALKKIQSDIKPDIYICHLLRMVPFFEKLKIRENVIVQMSDVLSKTYKLSSNSEGSFVKKIIYNLERSPIQKYEEYVVNNYPKVVLVSEFDKNFFGERNNVFYHNNGIRKIITNENYDKNKIVFVGNMRTLQNVDGCLHFVNDIFPKILEKNPDAVLHIVGSSPSDSIIRLQSEHIKVTGFLNSIEDYIKDACVSVASIRVAAGIQNKVLISMACHVPVILSTLISNGIPQLISGQNCIIEDAESSFADECVKLMEDSKYRNSIADEAMTMVEQNYFWNIHLQDYEVIQK